MNVESVGLIFMLRGSCWSPLGSAALSEVVTRPREKRVAGREGGAKEGRRQSRLADCLPASLANEAAIMDAVAMAGHR